MKLIDTHAHLYLDRFDEDRKEMMNRALLAGVRKILLPNIDIDSISDLKNLCMNYPDLVVPMMGLHPTSVKEDYQNQLEIILAEFEKMKLCAVGEIGIDLYWDQSFLEQQIDAFKKQLNWSIEKDLPVAIHMRNSYDEVMSVIKQYPKNKIRGVFHCFTGTLDQAQEIIDYGFYLGIGGVLTYKNSGLDAVIKEIDLSHLLLETDAPFLPPVPHRGKRNESSYLLLIAAKIATIKGIAIKEVAETTTNNAVELFKL